MEQGNTSATHHSISGYILPETLFHYTEPVTFSITYSIKLKTEYQTTENKSNEIINKILYLICRYTVTYLHMTKYLNVHSYYIQLLCCSVEKDTV
jgi:hypothetical protein